MAELVLLPKIESFKGEVIVATGTSCRHQIADFSQRKAEHLVDTLWEHLVDKVAIASSSPSAQIQVMDAIGRVYYEGTLPDGQNLDISEWPRGTYVVRMDEQSRLLLVR